MSSSTTNDRALTPYQHSFVERLVQDANPGSCHVLIAPVGSGKSFGMAAAVHALMDEGRARRTLILCPAVLGPQWISMLAGNGVPSVGIDGRSMRLMRAEYPVGTAWPEGCYVVGIDLAKRNDSMPSITGTPWDLLLVDEVDRLSGQREVLVSTLLHGNRAPASILASNCAYEALFGLLREGGSLREGVTVVSWNDEVAAHWEVERAGASTKRILRHYTRAPDEIAIIEQTLRIAKSMPNSEKTSRFKALSLVKAAASSVAALESHLVRRLEHLSADDVLRTELECLLESVEDLDTDERLRAFTSLLSELVTDGVQHVVVFCEYLSTLDYLYVTAGESELTAYGLTGELAEQQRAELMQHFEHDGGVLLTTDAGSSGLSLNYVDVAIHYDLPMKPASYEQRVGRYDRWGRTKACTTVLFHDDSDALWSESMLLRLIEKADALRQTKFAGNSGDGANALELDLLLLLSGDVATGESS